MEIQAPKVVFMNDSKDNEIVELKAEINRLKRIISDLERKSHHMKGVLNGRANRNRNWY